MFSRNKIIFIIVERVYFKVFITRINTEIVAYKYKKVDHFPKHLLFMETFIKETWSENDNI